MGGAIYCHNKFLLCYKIYREGSLDPRVKWLPENHSADEQWPAEEESTVATVSETEIIRVSFLELLGHEISD